MLVMRWIIPVLAIALLGLFILHTSSLQATTLPYYIDQNTSTLWFHVPGISPGQSITVYISTRSAYPQDPSSTFMFFDNFDANSLDSTKWQVSVNSCSASSGVSVSDGIAVVSGQSPNTALCQVFLESKQYWDYVPGYDYHLVFTARDPNWGGLGASGYYRAADHGIMDANLAYTPKFQYRWLKFYVGENGRKLTYAYRVNGYLISSSASDDVTQLSPQNWYTADLSWDSNTAYILFYVAPPITPFGTGLSDINSFPFRLAFFVSQWWSGKPPSVIQLDKVYLARIPKGIYVSPVSCSGDLCTVTITNNSSQTYTDFQVRVPVSELNTLSNITELYVGLVPPRVPTSITLSISK